MTPTVPLLTDAIVRLMVDAEAAGYSVIFPYGLNGHLRIAKERRFSFGVVVSRGVVVVLSEHLDGTTRFDYTYRIDTDPHITSKIRTIKETRKVLGL